MGGSASGSDLDSESEAAVVAEQWAEARRAAAEELSRWVHILDERPSGVDGSGRVLLRPRVAAAAVAH